MTPLLVVALVLQGVPASQDTTTGRPCRVAVDSMGHYAEIPNADGTKTLHGGGGVLAHCDGTSTTISATALRITQRSAGSTDWAVVIRDTALALDARTASYFLKDERLEAHNNVVAVNRRTGSILRGPISGIGAPSRASAIPSRCYATQRPTVEYRQNQPGRHVVQRALHHRR